MLLPEVLTLDYGAITKNGIAFNGSYFTSSIAIREQWFSINDESETRKIPVYFDPNNPESLLLIIDGVGLVRAVKIEECSPIADEILQSYFSIFKELKNKWKNKKVKRRRKI